MRPGLLLVLTLSLATLGGCKDASEKRKRQQALDELAESDRKLSESLEKGMGPRGLQPDHEARANQQKALESASELIEGKEGEAFKILADIQAESNALAKELEARTKTFVATLNWQSLAREADYEARRKLLTETIQFNKDVLKVFEDRPADVKRRLDAIGFKGPQRRDFETGFRSGYLPMLEIVREIRACDIRGCEIGLRLMDLFEKNDGKWRWNAISQEVQFDDEAAASTFNAEMLSYQQVGEKQIQLQTRIIENMKR